ncbi:MAG: HD domain-containing protein, partial [Aquabacterium sp.]|nr:HD domain-containing protein [Aquabacterium sp.]
MDMSARLRTSLAVRYACLGHDLGKGTTPPDVLPRHLGHEGRSAQLLKQVNERLRVPVECRELADVVAREHGNVHRSDSLNAAAVLRLLERCDAFRKPQRFREILQACECDARGRLGLQDDPYPQAERLSLALDLALAVPTADVSAAAQQRGLRGEAIGQAVAQARVEALERGGF